MKKISLVVLVFCVMVLKCNAQTNPWWENKYGINHLEELGLEELKLQQMEYKNNKIFGVVLIPMGVGLSALGVHQLMNSLFTADNTGGGLFLIGIGASVSGCIVSVVNANRQKDIKKAINSFDSHSNLNVNAAIQTINSDVGVQLTVSYNF